MRVCFYTLGCKVNLNETEALEQLFEHNGFTVVPESEPADVYIVNSCTVTNFGDQKSRKWLRQAKRKNPGAVTVITGCYPQAFPEAAAQLLAMDPHSPAEFRCNVTAANIDEFHAAFGVKPGDGMWRDPADRVSIW